jgi:hypothetical protein
MCFVWLSEETVRYVLYIINRLAFITDERSVYCAVRAESLYNTDKKAKFSLEQATKAQRVSRGIALPFHDLGT